MSVEGADISVQPGFAAALSLPRGAILERLPHLRTLVDWTCHVVESDSFQIPPTPLHKPAGKRVSATGQERERLREILLQQIAQSSLPFDAESFASNCLDLFDALSHSTAVFVTGDALSGKTSCWRTLAAALEALYGVTGNREGGQTRVQGEEGWVNARVMCPGALTQEELLGAYGQTHQVWSHLICI